VPLLLASPSDGGVREVSLHGDRIGSVEAKRGMAMSISTGKNHRMNNEVVFRKVAEHGGARDVSTGQTGKRVEVELTRERRSSERRELGSLSERHGLRMDLSQRPGGSTHASIAVPRAKTQAEAEATVASLLDWIRLRALG
jgi:hypothetical protein